MKRLKSSAAGAGYDQEELYFFKKDQELIQKNRLKPNLRLIQGEKKDAATDLVEVENQQKSDLKKAA